MAIVEIKKLNLIAMSYDKDRLLDALQKTGAVEVKAHTELEDTVIPSVCVEPLREEIAATETALETLTIAINRYESDRKIKSTLEKDGFFLSYVGNIAENLYLHSSYLLQ